MSTAREEGERAVFQLFRSRLVWWTIGVLTLAGTAFWIVAAIVAGLMTTAAGGADPDPDELARAAVPIGLLTATGAVVFGIALTVMVRRGRTRRWLPLRDQMVHDAATLPNTYLAQLASAAEPAAGGQVVAVDLLTGYQGPLWLPGWNLPRGAVVCFSTTSNGTLVRAWTTGRLWRATTREAARIERRTARALAIAEREQHAATERRVQAAVKETITEAERILRQHNLG